MKKCPEDGNKGEEQTIAFHSGRNHMLCSTWLYAEVCIAQHRSQWSENCRKGMKMFADNSELVSDIDYRWLQTQNFWPSHLMTRQQKLPVRRCKGNADRMPAITRKGIKNMWEKYPFAVVQTHDTSATSRAFVVMHSSEERQRSMVKYTQISASMCVSKCGYWYGTVAVNRTVE